MKVQSPPGIDWLYTSQEYRSNQDSCKVRGFGFLSFPLATVSWKSLSPIAGR